MRPFDDILILDELETCPYLPQETARMPLRYPSVKPTGADTDRRLAAGQRRTGDFVYHTQCPHCKACESIRIPVADFVLDKTMRRTVRRNDERLTMETSPVVSDSSRIDLFNLHREFRGLGRDDSPIDLENYAWAFGRSCFETNELVYYWDDRLVCVAITDYGDDSLSAVYTYYDPRLPKMSLGTYSILKQIELCREAGRQYLYLGFYIAQCAPMAYKARFLPNERLIGDQWVRFEK